MIHPEGYRMIVLTAVFALALNLIMVFFLPGLWPWVLIASLLLLLFVLQFFRYPKRRVTQQNLGSILAPADGKVVVIEEVDEQEYFQEKRLQVSIFMSIFDVHLNTSPLEGDLLYHQHHPGRYLAAWNPKSSVENERTTMVIRNANGDLLMRQIAGAVARRIRNYLTTGQAVKQGQEVGFILFGSRVDLLLPLDVELKVGLGEKVRFNRTVIARFTSQTAS